MYEMCYILHLLKEIVRLFENKTLIFKYQPTHQNKKKSKNIKKIIKFIRKEK